RSPTLFPYTTLFRSADGAPARQRLTVREGIAAVQAHCCRPHICGGHRPPLQKKDEAKLRYSAADNCRCFGGRSRRQTPAESRDRSEEHTSELQSRSD